MFASLWIFIFLVITITFVYRRARLTEYCIVIAAYLAITYFIFSSHHLWVILCAFVFAFLFIPLVVPGIRRRFYTSYIFSIFKKVMPSMSSTEQEALEAGTVGWAGELFSGNPDWHKLTTFPKGQLNEEEQEFLDGPVETLCQMISAWEISRTMQIPDEIWSYVRNNGFFSMIIPKKYGGKGFSALMHSAVICKISSVTSSVATAVSVPNSLGPAELLLRYGTDEQREYYLPRLAKGLEVPCFALTSPLAGSDAGSIEDFGIVCEAEFQGQRQLCIRLNWNKRYITLAPLATILGLAFKLYDPDNLLGKGSDLGITCALVPTDTPNVKVGRRHYPVDSAFPNGPTQGHDVIIPMSYIIGGKDRVGHGWRMLMECLATGRGISLPSIVTGGARRSVLCSGAYSRIRRQFNTHIGNFEGIQDLLGRMLGRVFTINATRDFILSAIDHGEEPVVESAISKYHVTEMARKICLDTMDLHGGKAICMGPNNYAAQDYFEIPIAITVEGANILTRSMIIFGQGVMRCHPYVLPEIQATRIQDKDKALRAFDNALFSHIGFFISNKVRSLLLGLTLGKLAKVPAGPLASYYQQFTRFSSALAFVADLSMVTLGGKLKRMEFLSARLGDVLSYLHMGSSVIRQWHILEKAEADEFLPVVHWSCQELIFQIGTAFAEFISNFPKAWLRFIMRMYVFPLGIRAKRPKDSLTSQLANKIVEPGVVRNYLAQGLYQSDAENNFIKTLSTVMSQIITVEPLLKKLKLAHREGKIKGYTFEQLVQDAEQQGEFSADEATLLLHTREAQMKIVNVDDFCADEMQRSHAPKVEVQ